MTPSLLEPSLVSARPSVVVNPKLLMPSSRSLPLQTLVVLGVHGPHALQVLASPPPTLSASLVKVSSAAHVPPSTAVPAKVIPLFFFSPLYVLYFFPTHTHSLTHTATQDCRVCRVTPCDKFASRPRSGENRNECFGCNTNAKYVGWTSASGCKCSKGCELTVGTPALALSLLSHHQHTRRLLLFIFFRQKIFFCFIFFIIFLRATAANLGTFTAAKLQAPIPDLLPKLSMVTPGPPELAHTTDAQPRNLSSTTSSPLTSATVTTVVVPPLMSAVTVKPTEMRCAKLSPPVALLAVKCSFFFG